MAEPDPALAIQHAAVAYGRVPVLEDIDGEVRPGQSVALIGPNGAGKTTLGLPPPPGARSPTYPRPTPSTATSRSRSSRSC